MTLANTLREFLQIQGDAMTIEREGYHGAHNAPLKPRVLFVDDDEELCALVQADLSTRDLAVQTASTCSAALQALHDAHNFDVVITDLCLPDRSGIDLCRSIGETSELLPVVVATGNGTMNAAIEAIRAGAYDFVTKPLDLDTMDLVIRRSVRHLQLSKEVERLRAERNDKRNPGGLIGNSPAMRKVFDVISRLGPSEANVLITGESGTGKELVARAIHEQSRRREGPFVAINCAAVPENLLESELFGHVKGAFTDAKAARPGLFAQADGGTLFLDEIGELPMAMQPKLLRALQERAVKPVGGDTEVKFDLRVIAATNRDLEDEVRKGTFRDDLFYRINVVSVHLPPLRARGNDTLLLAHEFLKRYADSNEQCETLRLSAPVAERLLVYSWPGNVRELENCIERTVALAQTSEITLEELPPKIRNFRTEQIVVDSEKPEHIIPLDELQKRYVRRAISIFSGNKARAARALGMDRRTLYRKLGRWAQNEEDLPMEDGIDDAGALVDDGQPVATAKAS